LPTRSWKLLNASNGEQVNFGLKLKRKIKVNLFQKSKVSKIDLADELRGTISIHLGSFGDPVSITSHCERLYHRFGRTVFGLINDDKVAI
jgi:hypothetical protein